MHTKSYFSLIVAVLLLHFTSFAQPNSVVLKSGTTVLSTHNGIISAYSAIPATLTQPYTIELDSGYHAVNDTFPINFIAKTGASAANTITLTISDVAQQNSGVTITCNTNNRRMFVFNNSDWVIIDGRHRPSSTGSSLQLIGTGANRELILFQNGARNNAVRGCFMMNTQYSQNGASCVRFGAGGNSRNRVNNCVMIGSPNAILSEGAAVSPNDNITIASNQFVGVSGYAFKATTGTGRTLIDSNVIDIFPSEKTHCIWYEGHRDTAIVSRNTILLNNQFAIDTVVKGIYFSTVGNAAYARIQNNIIANTAQVSSSGQGSFVEIDSATHVTGIEFAGNNPLSAEIYHNTIRLMGASSGATANALTAGLARYESHSGSVYHIANNIIINTRTGGGTGSKHVNMIMNSAGIAMGGLKNYNTYESAGTDMIEWGTTMYSSMAAYKAAGFEPNSDSLGVKFMSRQNLHLAPSMAMNPALQGTSTPIAGRDIDFQVRTWPYRGADEYAIACAGNLLKGEIFGFSDTVCANESQVLEVFGQNTSNGTVYQWQSRPAGSTADFTDIPGAVDDYLMTTVTAPTEFRFKDSCLAGGSPSYSDTVTLNIFPDINIDSITETHTGLTYKFTPHGVTGAQGYFWFFGDGNFVLDSISPTHTYSDSGVYTVKLIVFNNCGVDSVDLQIHAQDPAKVKNITGINTFTLRPNPTSGQAQIMLDNINPVDVTVTVVSITGQVVYKYSGRATEANYKHELDLSREPKGMYIIRVQAGAEQMVQKLLLQ